MSKLTSLQFLEIVLILFVRTGLAELGPHLIALLPKFVPDQLPNSFGISVEELIALDNSDTTGFPAFTYEPEETIHVPNLRAPSGPQISRGHENQK
jgi:hypothetical protein